METNPLTRFAPAPDPDIVPYEPGDRVALLKFQRDVYGPHALQLDEQRFIWLHQRNPHAAAGPDILICRKEGQIVGQQSALPFELKAGAFSLRAHWAIDLVVHPGWRLRGVGPALAAQFSARHDVALGLGVSDDGARMLQHFGWIDLGRLPSFVHVLDLERVVRQYPPHKLLAPLARLAQPVLGTVQQVVEHYARNHRANIYSMERFDERVDDFWEKVSPFYPVIARRDYQALRWRFDAVPDRERYTRLYLLERDRLRGYAVLRRAAWRNETVGSIVDYLAYPSWTAPLLAHCVTYLRGSGGAAILLGTRNAGIHSTLRLLGFIPRNTGPRFLLRLNEPRSALMPLLGAASNWYLTMADSDVDFYMDGS